MQVDVKDVIKALQKKSDGSLTFAVAIACLEETEKQAQILKIIKEKQVNVRWLICCKTLNEYNNNRSPWEFLITQEEFDLMKGYYK